MNRFLSIMFKGFISINATIITWLVSFFAFDQSFLLSSSFSVAGGIVMYAISSSIMKIRFMKKSGVTRKEYRYIQENLAEAKQKIFRLNKALISIRHVPSWKQRIDLIRMTRKIYSITKNEPKRFYRADSFFFSHLDSAVELSERYVFLSSQPKRNDEIERALTDTRETLENLTKTIEQDLYDLISNDLDQLHFEIDVAKNTLKNKKDIKINDESRKLK
ncbi:5-bromo-4-chloroindolyl phosphate hydrolysis family protein [Litchfieldia salsa]|uniref:5-bromo-4-chloroindolyl phosphate hydrolysis protein n=1 Tax=Litchfieldia salsa TaxID=930152 RepID=A0A1H0VWN7_9BACI|nr:5-bromo-4-chloroindolyl phosphate hydrolysis family protein [Litchfieldia salsa]SDP82949.1 5-bromo-4-chloroindolyl phosphate hydrolysis protein [Litchfieldia salsa]